MTLIQYTGDRLWARMERAVDKVQARLGRAAAALDRAGVPYAVVGGLAVRVWVAQADEAAVRNTRDVDLLVRRADLDAIKDAMDAAGFVFRQSAGLTMFLDNEQSSPRDAVHLVFAGEMVRDDDPEPNPSPNDDDSVSVGDLRVLELESLVRMKLNSHRLKDRVHLLDLLEVGLIDDTWPGKFPAPLSDRLQHLIDHPDA
ncbi:nucleotidyltransferase family protein [Phycisphaeraceae bacterium D3-23]